AHAKAGETVLIHGASGGVGVAACQLSRALGLKEATEGRGIDVIVEMLSNIIGCRGSIEINPRDTMAKESSIMGVAVFFATPEENKECAALLYAGMEAGWLRPVVGSQYPLDKAAQAHHDIIECPGAAGKIVLT
ncbi:hypothetical protein FQN60_016402, partial [Etheostoma spectabile]